MVGIFRSFDWLAAGLLLAAPLMPVEAAAIAGSEFLADWNLIVFDNLDSRAKIEGKSFVGGETRIRNGGGPKEVDPKDAKEPAAEEKSGDGKPGDFTEDVRRQREELLRASQGLSEHLRSLAATDKAIAEKGTLTIQGSEKLSVFDLSLEDFDKIDEIRIDIPDGTAVVLNIAGTSGRISSTIDGKGLGTNGQLIWNFYEADDLRLRSDIYGTLLSPYADLRNDGTIEGTVVAASLDQRGELRMGPAYQHETPAPDQVSAAPEPASWLMLILGFGLIGAMLRHRTHHAPALTA